MNYIDGEILYIDKPYRWTSFDVVKRLRGELTRRLHCRKLKVGHAGTLDPLATGVMIVCTGRATKQIDTLQASVKEYVATISLGATTPSFDLETEIDATYPTEHITRQLVEQTLLSFIGTINQTPPAYSAIKINGERAYTFARRGEQVEMKTKTLVIDTIELLDYQPNEITLRIVCSKGTYIRALARDIGQALNSGAHLTALRRTRIGKVTIDQCLSPADMVKQIKELPVEMPETKTEQ
ncbi:MAG: tRNA pseudouridine(55) synthase TruB [Muribaculum sp.]|nr:tRNA pseudouridine(55) synthase TruB [Muribaculaceae bacterium]MCM1080369.1 tRNA pseudouridine(55) synthase TruB [Muribaculum sp.]